MIRKIGLLIYLCAAAGAWTTHSLMAQSPYDDQIDALLARMTLQEKVGQMVQYNGFYDVSGPAPKEGDAAKKYEHLRAGRVGSMLNVKGVDEVRELQRIAVEDTRLGIPLIFGFDVIHGHRTLSPIPLAEAASWDLDAIQQSARNAAEEASSRGINWTFAPNVDISRDPRWGRVMEGAGEDPYLGSQIAHARVRGFQGTDLSDPSTIVACAKHYAGYGFAEAGRDYNTVDVSPYTLHNIILPPFKAAVEAGVGTFMNGFNVLNGTPVTGSSYLQRDLLKGAWGFSGFIVSDWASIAEMIPHGYARDLSQASEIAIQAGSDMDMESYAYINYLEQAVEEGSVDISLIDEAVRRILHIKYALGLMDDPYRYCDIDRENKYYMNPRHLEQSRDLARKSIVLLKNESSILPLHPDDNILILGSLAGDKTSPLGNWRFGSEDGSGVSVVEGIQAIQAEAPYVSGPELFPGGGSFLTEVTEELDLSDIDDMLDAAHSADKIIIALGEHGFQSGEGRSRTRIGLPGHQLDMLQRIYAVNPNIILLVMSGRPLELSWADEHLPAILACWQLGTQTGHAIADVLYASYNPSGRLPMSFPRHVGQLPLYYNRLNTGRPMTTDGSACWSHYIDEENTALYPFGYGLSYTDWDYSDLQVSVDTMGTVTASIQLRNTGTRSGVETVQLYIRDHYASLVRPIRELKGYQQITLAPGAQYSVDFRLSRDELGFYDATGSWIVEPGTYSIGIGKDSESIVWKEIEIQ